MIENQNFMATAIEDIPVDTEYRWCNFSRRNCIDVGGEKKGVRLFPGDDTPRTFISCNMVNCEPPPGSTQIECNTTIKAKAVEVGSDVIEIDGEAIVVIDYANVRYGRYIDGQYVYRTPIETPCETPED